VTATANGTITAALAAGNIVQNPGMLVTIRNTAAANASITLTGTLTNFAPWAPAASGASVIIQNGECVTLRVVTPGTAYDIVNLTVQNVAIDITADVTLSAAITSSALTNGGLITYTNTGTTNLTLTAAAFDNAATYPVQSTAAVFTLPPKGTVTLQLTSTSASNWRIISFEYPGLQAGAIAFAVSKTTAQTVPANSEQVVTFDVADINPQNYFDTVTSRYTPEIAGYYNFSATLTVSSVTITTSVAIYKNGIQACRGTCGQSESNATGTITDVIYMNGTTDYVDMRCTTGGGTGPIFTGQTFFSGSLVTQQNIVNTASGIYNVPANANTTIPALLAAVTPTPITDVVGNEYIITNTATSNITLTATSFIGYEGWISQAQATSIVMTPGTVVVLQTVTIGTGYQIVNISPNNNVNSVAFAVYNSANLPISSAGTNISNVAIRLNPQNYYDNSTGRYTPKTAGYYQVNCGITTNGSGGNGVQMQLRKNGVAYNVQPQGSDSNAAGAQIADVVYMNGSTDYLSVFADSSTSYNVQANNFWFSASLTNQTLTEVVGTTAAGAVVKSTAQAIANNTFTKVTLPGPATDPQSWWNAANNRWIPTIPGYYEVSGMLSYFSLTANTLYEIFILKNGFTVVNGLYPSNISAATFLTGTANTVVYMNGTTDYLEMWTYQSSGAAQSIEGNPTRTNLTLSLVGANQAVPAVRETTSAYGIGSNTTGSNQYANCEIDNLRFFWRGGGGASVFISTISGTTTIQGAYGRNAYGGGADAWGLAPGVGSGPLTVTTTPVALTVNWSTMGQIIATFRDIGAGRSYQMNAVLQHSYQNSQIFVNRISD
jgi:hypothetical protein